MPAYQEFAIMKKSSAKLWVLVLSVTAPGMCALSCSSTILQEFRDAVIQGAAGALEGATADLIAGLFAVEP